MERADLLMVAMEAYPELKARGFFTVIRGNEYYFSGLQKMEIESAYKPFYEEYDLAFSIRCTYSVCDYKSETRWKRMDGDHHVFKTPVLYLISRSDLDASPSAIVNRMVTHYRANALVIEKYHHPDYSISSLKSYLLANGMYLVLKENKQKQDYLNDNNAASINAIKNQIPLLESVNR